MHVPNIQTFDKLSSQVHTVEPRLTTTPFLPDHHFVITTIFLTPGEPNAKTVSQFLILKTPVIRTPRFTTRIQPVNGGSSNWFSMHFPCATNLGESCLQLESSSVEVSFMLMYSKVKFST